MRKDLTDRIRETLLMTENIEQGNAQIHRSEGDWVLAEFYRFKPEQSLEELGIRKKECIFLPMEKTMMSRYRGCL